LLVIGIEHRALHLLGKHSTTWAALQSLKPTSIEFHGQKSLKITDLSYLEVKCWS
jgi:hypothetical protein